MADYGLKVSKSGEDVKTATGDDLVFSSAYNTPKIFMEGVGSVAVNDGADGTVEITHSLTYKPSYLVYMEGIADTNKVWFSHQPSDVTGEFAWSENMVDATKLYIKVSNDTGSNDTFYFYYYIFYDQGA